MAENDPALPAAALSAAVAEVKAYLRVVQDDEDAVVARLAASAASLCEQFCGQALIVRGFSEMVRSSATWTRLGATPVREISSVEALGTDGSVTLLAAGAYGIDIDANGDGWVRVTDAAGSRRVQVGYRAGMAEHWEGVPETLRQGIVRLAAHLHAHRSAAPDAGPPAVVTALWRPWRRMRLR